MHVFLEMFCWTCEWEWQRKQSLFLILFCIWAAFPLVSPFLGHCIKLKNVFVVNKKIIKWTEWSLLVWGWEFAASEQNRASLTNKRQADLERWCLSSPKRKETGLRWKTHWQHSGVFALVLVRLFQKIWRKTNLSFVLNIYLVCIFKVLRITNKTDECHTCFFSVQAVTPIVWIALCLTLRMRPFPATNKMGLLKPSLRQIYTLPAAKPHQPFTQWNQCGFTTMIWCLIVFSHLCLVAEDC